VHLRQHRAVELACHRDAQAVATEALAVEEPVPQLRRPDSRSLLGGAWPRRDSACTAAARCPSIKSAVSASFTEHTVALFTLHTEHTCAHFLAMP
jgi:hypothetical protein